MKALSVMDPWATLIMRYGKSTENRDYPTNYRGDLVIHASRRIDRNGWLALNEAHDGVDALNASTLANAHRERHELIMPTFALGLVELVGVDQLQYTKWDIPGMWHWRLRNPRPFKTPFTMKGQLSLFEVPDDLIRRAMGGLISTTEQHRRPDDQQSLLL